MAVPSFPDQGPPRAARSIHFQFAVRLAVPVVVLILLWAAAAAAALDGVLDGLPGFRSAAPHHQAVLESSVIIGAGLVVVLVALLLTWAFTRRVTRELAGLAAGAGQLAAQQQPGSAPWTGASSAEVEAVAAALLGMQRTASAAAAAEAGVRNGLRQILASLGKRNQSLLHRQLRIIDTLEQQAESPSALGELFALDHLTTRMRRHAESLSIISGAAPARSWSGPVPVIDVIRSAVSEIEDYQRVTTATDATETVIAAAVTDLIHLLAELVENATLFSPSSTRVEVRAERVANGFAIEVEDRGLGMEPGQLTAINAQLADPPDFDVADADRLGLFVTGRLAAKHAIQVSLAPSAYRGIKAIVLLPEAIVTTPPDSGAGDPAYGGSIRPSLRSSEALSLVGTARARSLTTIDTDGVSGPGDAMDEYDEAPYPGDGDAFDDAGTFHGLPRRVRPGGGSAARAASAGGGGAHAGGAGPAGSASAHVPPEAPAPEHARNLFSSLQSGWLRSRETDDDIPGSGAGDTGDYGTSTASGPSVEWLDDTEHDATPEKARHDEEM
jgi:signal transduction histidine kinase